MYYKDIRNNTWLTLSQANKLPELDELLSNYDLVELPDCKEEAIQWLGEDLTAALKRVESSLPELPIQITVEEIAEELAQKLYSIEIFENGMFATQLARLWSKITTYPVHKAYGLIVDSKSILHNTSVWDNKKEALYFSNEEEEDYSFTKRIKATVGDGLVMRLTMPWVKHYVFHKDEYYKEEVTDSYKYNGNRKMRDQRLKDNVEECQMTEDKFKDAYNESSDDVLNEYITKAEEVSDDFLTGIDADIQMLAMQNMLEVEQFDIDYAEIVRDADSLSNAVMAKTVTTVEKTVNINYSSNPELIEEGVTASKFYKIGSHNYNMITKDPKVKELALKGQLRDIAERLHRG